MRFAILVPKSLDPVVRGRRMPLPDARPSEKIAKLFPQVDPPKDQNNGAKPPEPSAAPAAAQPPAAVAQASTPLAAAAKPVPLPEARPNVKPVRDGRRHRHVSQYRRR
jgi:membrane-bound lytic murein transglycosylase A